MTNAWRKLRTARALSGADLWLVGRALFTRATVEVGLRVVPLPALAGALGVRVGRERSEGDQPAPSESGSERKLDVELLRARQAAEVVMRNWPARRPCLRRALVLGRLLEHHGPLLRLGAAPTKGGFFAHAWLEINGRIVPGTEASATELGALTRAVRPLSLIHI